MIHSLVLPGFLLYMWVLSSRQSRHPSLNGGERGPMLPSKEGPQTSELQLDGKGGDVLVLAPSNGPLPHGSLVNTESSREETLAQLLRKLPEF